MPAVTWNRRLGGVLTLGNLIRAVPMAITYESDVGPHLRRGLWYRKLGFEPPDGPAPMPNFLNHVGLPHVMQRDKNAADKVRPRFSVRYWV